jgi:F-type H+-transporting ATPase subunit delta
MIRDPVAKRYARAAFEIARDRGTLDEWAADLALLATVMADARASAFLSDTRAALSERHRFLENTLEGVDPLVLNLAKLLVAKGRVAIAPQVVEAYENLVDEHRGVSHAEVLTAVPLSDDEKRAVEERLSELTGTKVIARLEVQPEIVGGVLARVGDRLIDGSTRGRLMALRRSLVGQER